MQSHVVYKEINAYQRSTVGSGLIPYFFYSNLSNCELLTLWCYTH